MIKKWLNRRRINRDERQYLRGYNQAAGLLLRGEVKAGEVIELIGERHDSAYDSGARAAVADFRDIVTSARGRAIYKRAS